MKKKEIDEMMRALTSSEVVRVNSMSKELLKLAEMKTIDEGGLHIINAIFRDLLNLKDVYTERILATLKRGDIIS